MSYNRCPWKYIFLLKLLKFFQLKFYIVFGNMILMCLTILKFYIFDVRNRNNWREDIYIRETLETCKTPYNYRIDGDEKGKKDQSYLFLILKSLWKTAGFVNSFSQIVLLFHYFMFSFLLSSEKYFVHALQPEINFRVYAVEYLIRHLNFASLGKKFT